MSDLESERTRASAADLMCAAGQLGKPLSYFLPANFPEPDITEEECDVLRDYRRMWHEENRILARKLLRETADRETEQDLAQQRKEHEQMRAERKPRARNRIR